MILASFQNRKAVQLIIGLAIGICFGFLLQKGGVTEYDVIIGQLLLEDFTVAKVMLSAVITGMLGIFALRSLGFVNLHPKEGSLGATVIGGLLFGVGFALLGYCPGTVAGAVGQGSLDALLGGLTGILFGAGIFAAMYARLDRGILKKGAFGKVTFPELLGLNAWAVVIPVSLLLLALLFVMERYL